MTRYYFAGGMYPSKAYPYEYAFYAVGPKGESPYVWNDFSGAIGVEHHASIYLLSEDIATATLIEESIHLPSPKQVTLSFSLQNELRKAIWEKYRESV